jgi:hypothetical protein
MADNPATQAFAQAIAAYFATPEGQQCLQAAVPDAMREQGSRIKKEVLNEILDELRTIRTHVMSNAWDRLSLLDSKLEQFEEGMDERINRVLMKKLRDFWVIGKLKVLDDDDVRRRRDRSGGPSGDEASGSRGGEDADSRGQGRKRQRVEESNVVEEGGHQGSGEEGTGSLAVQQAPTEQPPQGVEAGVELPLMWQMSAAAKAAFSSLAPRAPGAHPSPRAD